MKGIKQGQLVKLFSRTGEAFSGIIVECGSDRVYVQIFEQDLVNIKKYKESDEFLVDVKTILGTQTMKSCLINELNISGIICIENSPQTSKIIQRREFVRIDCRFTFAIYNLFHSYNCQCVNISVGGIAFKSAEKYEVNNILKVALPQYYFGKNIACKVKIIKADSGFYVGTFENLNQTQESLISKFIFKKINEE